MREFQPEKVVAVGLKRANQTAGQFASLMHELSRLVETAGGTIVKEFSQTKPHPDPATLLGSGKIIDIGKTIKNLGVATVVFDDDLTAAQQKNIEKVIQAKIIDRTRLILDIFAKRARSREGQLQVELAQLNYLVPRLTGAWRGFSQQVGGIGTRGPGERKIEVERRYVRERIKRLKKEIEEIRRHRGLARTSRQEVPIPQVSLVGYTNVGKSTLLNTLVGKDDMVYADDKLFATLDPTTRRVKLPGGQQVLFTDTVGFIQKLPEDLMTAFRATLEEMTQSALLIHVVDASAEDRVEQEKNVLKVLRSIGAGDIHMITAFNKSDLLTEHQKEFLRKKGDLLISSKSAEGMEEFKKIVEQKLEESLLDVTFHLPYDKRALLAHIFRCGRVVSEWPASNGTQLRIRIDQANWKKLSHQLNYQRCSS